MSGVVNYSELRRDLIAKGLDFDAMADRRGKPIDEEIKPLLIVLNFLGYRTTSSCGGHSLDEHRSRVVGQPGRIIEEDEYHFVLEKMFGRAVGRLEFSQAPFVHLGISAEQLRKLMTTTEEYNRQNPISWGVTELGSEFRFSPDYRHSLQELQASILSLSDFIYLNR